MSAEGFAPRASQPPALVTTTNIRELFGWQPGETLDEAISRHQVDLAKVLAA